MISEKGSIRPLSDSSEQNCISSFGLVVVDVEVDVEDEVDDFKLNDYL